MWLGNGNTEKRHSEGERDGKIAKVRGVVREEEELGHGGLRRKIRRKGLEEKKNMEKRGKKKRMRSMWLTVEWMEGEHGWLDRWIEELLACESPRVWVRVSPHTSPLRVSGCTYAFPPFLPSSLNFSLPYLSLYLCTFLPISTISLVRFFFLS